MGWIICIYASLLSIWMTYFYSAGVIIYGTLHVISHGLHIYSGTLNRHPAGVFLINCMWNRK